MTIILQNMTEHKRSKIAECLKEVGLPNDKPTITTENRASVRSFFNGLGFPTEAYINLSLEELATAYYSVGGDGLGLLPMLLGMNADLTAVNLFGNTYECWKRTYMVGLENGQSVSGSTAGSDIISQHLELMKANGLLPIPKAAEPVQLPVVAPAPAKAQDAATALASAFATILAGSTKPDLDEGRVISLIREHAQATSIKLVSNTGVTEIQTGVHHKRLPEVITYLSAGVNVFMVGAAGSGKTTIADQAAKALGLPFYFNGALDSEYKLTGFIDAQGRIVSTAFRKAYETGGVYLFDEVDASLPSALLAFNAALANGHSDFPDGCIKKHEKFLCVAAANTYGKGADRLYVGRNQLDAATLDRFAVLNIDYDEKLERTLCGNDDWCNYVQGVRKAVFGLKIRHVVSPRASINGARLLAAGVSKDNVTESVIWKGLDEDSVTKIKQAMR